MHDPVGHVSPRRPKWLIPFAETVMMKKKMMMMPLRLTFSGYLLSSLAYKDLLTVH